MNLGASATVPSRKKHATATALVLDILERVHHIRNASQAAEAAKTESPGVR